MFRKKSLVQEIKYLITANDIQRIYCKQFVGGLS